MPENPPKTPQDKSTKDCSDNSHLCQITTGEDAHCEDSLHSPACAPKKKPKRAKGKRLPHGRPKNGSLEALAIKRERVIERQRRDCKALAENIRDARKGSPSASEVGQLARATATLHDLEERAYGIGKGSRAIQGVIALPAVADTMEAWEGITRGVLGFVEEKVAEKVRRVEPDVVGRPGDGDDD